MEWIYTLTDSTVRWIFNIFALAIFWPGIWAVLIGSYTMSSRYGPSKQIDLDESPLKGAFFVSASWTFGCLFLSAANPELSPWVERLGGPLAGLVPSNYLPIASAVNLLLLNICLVLVLRKIFGNTFSPRGNVDLPPEVIEDWADKCYDGRAKQASGFLAGERDEDAGDAGDYDAGDNGAVDSDAGDKERLDVKRKHEHLD